MKQIFLKKENNDNLILFLSGWGSDENLFNRETLKKHDYMICFDYSNLDFNYDTIMKYKRVIVIGWSMGVWVANNILSKEHAKKINIDLCIAINGTIYPIDNNKGIPTDIFKGTLDNFSENALARFRRRICGNTENLKEFLSHSPYRNINSLKTELSALWNLVSFADISESLKWNIAFIGMSDKIFPYYNQMSAWKEFESCKLIKLESEHYNSVLFNDLLLNLEKSKYLAI